MGPSPFRKHQRIAVIIFMQLDRFIEQNQLGFAYFSPLDIIFEEGENRLQTDIFFVRNDNAEIEQDWIMGVPDMVCEIISQSTYEMDTAVKRAIYEKYRVPEYLIIMPESMTVEILTIEADKYKLHSFAALMELLQLK
ncbi:MAG: Uma2 family endonuclease [Nitrospirota bacterium]